MLKKYEFEMTLCCFGYNYCFLHLLFSNSNSYLASKLHENQGTNPTDDQYGLRMLEREPSLSYYWIHNSGADALVFWNSSSWNSFPHHFQKENS